MELSKPVLFYYCDSYWSSLFNEVEICSLFYDLHLAWKELGSEWKGELWILLQHKCPEVQGEWGGQHTAPLTPFCLTPPPLALLWT